MKNQNTDDIKLKPGETVTDDLDAPPLRAHALGDRTGDRVLVLDDEHERGGGP